jgi:predicted outer membrane repeat protein
MSPVHLPAGVLAAFHNSSASAEGLVCKNDTAERGACFAMHNSSSLHLANSNISYNSATQDGGAFHLTGNAKITSL